MPPPPLNIKNPKLTEPLAILCRSQIQIFLLASRKNSLKEECVHIIEVIFYACQWKEYPISIDSAKSHAQNTKQ